MVLAGKSEKRERRKEKNMNRKALGRGEILILALGILAGLFSAFFKKPRQAVLYIPDYGEAERNQNVFYREGGKTEGKTGGELTVIVPARKYSDVQLQDMAEEAFSQISEQLLGENPSMDEISSRLVMQDWLPDFPFSISWQVDNTGLISPEGEILNEDLEESVICCLTAELTYEDNVFDREYCVRVLPVKYSDRELFEQELMQEINRYIEETMKAADSETKKIILPDRVLDAEVYGGKPDVRDVFIYPFLCLSSVVFMRVRKREREKERKQRRSEELLYAYPVFVNQLALYLSAGMNVGRAIRQLTANRNSREKPHMRTLFEEINRMLQMIENGVSEKAAYRSFGRACGHGEYKKLTELFVQTIEIGGKGVLDRLETLETEAFVMRKEQARIKGEMASTKLLVPMILLLAVVMALLMVPGFYGMGIM